MTMLTQEQFDNLQPGDKLQYVTQTDDIHIGEVQAVLKKVILILWDDNDINYYCFNELKFTSWSLVKPIKYNQGFEVREYPERPIVLVGDTNPNKLRFLVEVKEDSIICVGDEGERFCTDANRFMKWDLIQKVD